MANPFDDENGTFHVLRNARGQYSLWPVFAAVPDGWSVVLDSANRQAADDYIESHWTTLHPAHFLGAAGESA